MSPDLSGPFAGYGRTWRKRAGERRSKREGQDRIRVPAANPEPFPFQEERAPRNPHAGACRRPYRPPCGTSANGAGGDENLGGRVWFFFEFAYLCPNNKTGNSATGPTGRTQEKNCVPKGKEMRTSGHAAEGRGRDRSRTLFRSKRNPDKYRRLCERYHLPS